MRQDVKLRDQLTSRLIASDWRDLTLPETDLGVEIGLTLPLDATSRDDVLQWLHRYGPSGDVASVHGDVLRVELGRPSANHGLRVRWLAEGR